MRKLFQVLPLRNKILNRYVTESQSTLIKKDFDLVVEVMDDSIMLKHYFRNEYLTISLNKDNCITLVSETFPDGNLSKKEESTIKNL